MHLTKLLERSNAKYAVIDAADIRFDPAFRKICEGNACGYYGACWTCPPDAGEIGALIERARGYRRALVFQTVHPLEDSFDIEGMHAAGAAHNRFVQAVRRAARAEHPDALVLGAGACGICRRCAKRDGRPCRHPGRAVSSLEAYGIDVSALAKSSGLSYTNGPNTVTYFGAVLY